MNKKLYRKDHAVPSYLVHSTLPVVILVYGAVRCQGLSVPLVLGNYGTVCGQKSFTLLRYQYRYRVQYIKK